MTKRNLNQRLPKLSKTLRRGKLRKSIDSVLFDENKCSFQAVFTCLKATMEAPEKCVKSVQG